MEKADDKKYMALMGKYKELRMSKAQEAMKYLRAASKLRRQGEVSEDVILGSGYL
jgi:hypothetical protein